MTNMSYLLHMFFIKTGRQCCWFFLRVAELMADDRRHSVVPCVRTRDHVSEKGLEGWMSLAVVLPRDMARCSIFPG